MAKGFIKRSTLEAIADAIRSKTRSTGAILPADMARMIKNIASGVSIPPWATEVEMAQVTITSDSAILSVPCNMSAAPTGHLIMLAREVSTSAYNHFAQLSFDWLNYYDGQDHNTDWSAVFDYNNSYEPIMPNRDFGAVTLENGVAKFAINNGYKVYVGDMYNIIMWR